MRDPSTHMDNVIHKLLTTDSITSKNSLSHLYKFEFPATSKYLEYAKGLATFKTYLKEENFSDCAKIIISLITCESVSAEIRSKLLLESIDLIKKNAFVADEIYELLRCLESMKSFLGDTEVLKIRKELSQGLVSSFMTGIE